MCVDRIPHLDHPRRLGINGESISVVVATYQGERYIKEQFTSIVHQELPPNEIIVSDDSSRDRTIEIINSIGSPVPVVVTMNSQEKGYNGNFINGCQHARSDWVAFADQDDYWLPNKTRVLVDYMRRFPSAHLLIHDLDICDIEMRSTGDTKLSRMKKTGNVSITYVTGMATIVRKDFLELCLNQGLPHGISYDSWVHSCAAILNLKRVVPVVLAKYRRHLGAATQGHMHNAAQSLSPLQVARQRFASESTEILSGELRRLRALRHWVTNSSRMIEEVTGVPQGKIESAILKTQRKEAAVVERQALLTAPPAFRIPLALRFALAGKYRHFTGIQSLAKDLVSWL